MTISPPEREQKKEPVLDKPIETDSIPVDFSKLDKPGFWSKTLAKGPKTTTWISVSYTHLTLPTIYSV